MSQQKWNGSAAWIRNFMEECLSHSQSTLTVTPKMNGKYRGLAVKEGGRLIIDFYAHDDYIRGGVRETSKVTEESMTKWPGVEVSHPPRAKYMTLYIRRPEGLNAIRSLIGFPKNTVAGTKLEISKVQPVLKSDFDSPAGISSGELFSMLPARRLAAGHALNAEGRVELPAQWKESVKGWPMFSAGALNAWVIFVGVSPGNSTPDGVNLKAEHWLPTIGVSHPHAGRFRDKAGFWEKIRALVTQTLSESLPLGSNPLELFMVANLADDLNAAPTVADVRRAFGSGAAHLKRTLLLAQPRLVCVMKKTLAPKLIATINSWGWSSTSKGIEDVGSGAKAEFWHVKAPYGSMIVSQTGQHPSLYIPANLPAHLRRLVQQLISESGK